MQKVLITGGNGFVAHYIIKELLALNYEVIATGKGSSRIPDAHPNLIYEEMDFSNKDNIANVFNIHKPEIVVHAGAISKPDECELYKENAFLINVTGTINLLEQASIFKSFFIFLSTDFVFDGKKGMYREEDERSAVNYYGQTKILAEDEVFKYPFEWSIVRTVLVYGKPLGSRQNMLTLVAASLRKEEQLQIFNDQVRTPTYVEDLAKGITRIVNKKASGIFHLSGIDVLTPYQMALEVARYLLLDISLIHSVTENNFSQPAKRPLKTGFNIAKANKILDYQPIHFSEGLRRTFEND